MPSILDQGQREMLLARFRQLTPEHERLWGSLSAPAMVSHLSDQIRVALGDVETRPAGNILTHTLMKWLVVYLPVPAPKGKVQTSPEMLTTTPADWEADTRGFEELVSRLVRAQEVAPHPIFGTLSHREWCILAAKHMDHHLSQFAV